MGYLGERAIQGALTAVAPLEHRITRRRPISKKIPGTSAFQVYMAAESVSGYLFQVQGCLGFSNRNPWPLMRINRMRQAVGDQYLAWEIMDSQTGHSERLNFPIGETAGSGQVVFDGLRIEFAPGHGRNPRVVQVTCNLTVRTPQ